MVWRDRGVYLLGERFYLYDPQRMRLAPQAGTVIYGRLR